MFGWCEWNRTAVPSAQNVNTRARHPGLLRLSASRLQVFFPVLSDFAFYLGFYLSMAEHLHPIP